MIVLSFVCFALLVVAWLGLPSPTTAVTEPASFDDIKATEAARLAA
jgi:hypothetical protein